MQGERRAASAGTVELQGVLRRFIFEGGGERGFGIAVFTGEGELPRWVARGPLWGLNVGETVALTGRWVDDPRYGRQLLVHTARPVLPSTREGIAQYLVAAKIRGIGPKLADRVAETFGVETLAVIAREPERLAEVKGLGAARRAALVETLGPRVRRDAALVFLLDLGLGPVLAGRVVERFGEDAVRTVRHRPYSLAREIEGIGFALADRVAQAQGLSPEDPRRLEAGVLHALERLGDQGHTAPHLERLLEAAIELLGCPPALVAAACGRLVERGEVERLYAVRGAVSAERGGVSVHVGLRGLSRAEGELARELLRLARAGGAALGPEEESARVERAERALGFALIGPQRRAVSRALSAGVLVVTGGPGTGKTTIVQGVTAASEVDGTRVALAAPTGRAARRLSEATLLEASTVHRLLDFDPRTRRFERGPETPVDADLVIVDEASMLDTRLAAALFRALRPGARLLLVGDVDQLPSVGPGAVLEDLIASGCCEVVRLDRVHRQAERSLIVRAAHGVRRGRVPVGADRDNPGDFYVVCRERPEEITATLLEIVQHRLPALLGLDPIDDVQVIVPIHRGPLGTATLNERLGEALNPDGEVIGAGLRLGDKVIQTRNNYDLEVFNGDIGRILAREAGGVRVQMGEREVVFGEAAWGDLRPAYAITVHKSQGSEYPAVVLPLHMQHRMLLQRNLLYTGITRARRFAVLLGQRAAIARAVDNAAPHRRTTLLRQRLCGELVAGPGAVSQGLCTSPPG